MVHGTLAVPYSFSTIIGTNVHTCVKSCSIDSLLRQVVGVTRPFLAAYKGEVHALRCINGEVRVWAAGVAYHNWGDRRG